VDGLIFLLGCEFEAYHYSRTDGDGLLVSKVLPGNDYVLLVEVVLLAVVWPNS